MRIAGQERPFFVSFLVRDEEEWRLRARYGSLVRDVHQRDRDGYADVRVGSYRNDQLQDGGLFDNDKNAESYGYTDLPFGDSDDGLRHGLWRLADARYREALEALYDKRSHELTYLDANRSIPSFQRVKPTVDAAIDDPPAVDLDHWRDYVERASAGLKRFDGIKDGSVSFELSHSWRIFASSEGTRRIENQAIWSVECYLWYLSESGDAFPYTIKHTVTDPDELPDLAAFRREIRTAVAQLERLAAAPLLRSFSGPALLDPIPAGLLLHEAVGHRLEGNRLLASGEGQTFRDAVGKRVLPEFLSVHDDPRLERWEGRSLVGHYRFDDEGTTAVDARLIERGVLKGFLTGRTGTRRGHRTNGHARGIYHRRPISRMGSLIVEPHAGLDRAALKRRLLAEIERQGVPFGVRIVEATGGETSTDAYNFQAFLGEAVLVARVWPDGREEWVRGLNFVGTPLNAIRSIVAAGDRCEVDNAWCGAESGYVPVSTISPALLLRELEMQSKGDVPYTPYSYPIPWERPRKRKA